MSPNAGMSRGTSRTGVYAKIGGTYATTGRRPRRARSRAHRASP
jgi:hypothetical protein